MAKPNPVAIGRTMLGTPYVWGGNSPGTGLDCSGFIQQTYAKLGINLPRTTYDQAKVGAQVGLNQLEPGDAVFVEPTAQGPGHVGMYVGNGVVQESPHTGDVNKYIPLTAFLKSGFVTARRYVGYAGSGGSTGGAYNLDPAAAPRAQGQHIVNARIGGSGSTLSQMLSAATAGRVTSSLAAKMPTIQPPAAPSPDAIAAPFQSQIKALPSSVRA